MNIRSRGVMMRGVMLGALIFAVVIVWHFFIGRSFVRIRLGEGVTSFTITSETGRVITTGKHSNLANLPTGHYVVTYLHNDTTVAVQPVWVRTFFWRSVSPKVSTSSLKPAVLLHQGLEDLTPLGKGYLFIAHGTRALMYVDESGFTNLSDRIGLTTKPDDPDTPTYNTVTNIESTANGSAIITTPIDIFIMKDPSTITPLQGSPTEALTFSDSAYDAKTNSLFALSASSKNIYRYDLNVPQKAPSVLLSVQKEINRIASAGGKLVVYFDDIPTRGSDIVATYAEKRQLNPILIDAVTKKTTTLPDSFRPTTYAAFSADGNYLMLKQKLSSVMHIYSVNNGTSVSIPAFDTGGFAWQGTTLLFGRAGGVWSYEAAQPGSSPVKVVTMGAPIVRIAVAGHTLLVTTNTDTSYRLISTSTTIAAAQIAAGQLLRKPLQSEGYETAFYATDSTLRIIITGSESGVSSAQALLGSSLNAPFIRLDSMQPQDAPYIYSTGADFDSGEG